MKAYVYIVDSGKNCFVAWQLYKGSIFLRFCGNTQRLRERTTVLRCTFT
jgi:hypothetical protein